MKDGEELTGVLANERNAHQNIECKCYIECYIATVAGLCEVTDSEHCQLSNLVQCNFQYSCSADIHGHTSCILGTLVCRAPPSYEDNRACDGQNSGASSVTLQGRDGDVLTSFSFRSYFLETEGYGT